MCNEINTRVCSKNDIDQVLEIENECFEYPYPEYVFKDYLGSKLFLVAVNEERVLGYIISDIRENEGVVISIAVDPAFQRKGIGKRLIRKTIDNLCTEYIVLTVRVSNNKAQQFYENLGFKRFYLINNYYSNDEDAIVMGKKLKINE